MSKADVLPADLEIVGQLSILADESPLQVDFRGSVIEVALPDLQTALRLAKGVSRGDRRSWMRSIQASLARAGLELQVSVGHRQVGRLAAKSRSSWLARLLGVAPMELKTGTILASLFGRHPAASDDARSIDTVSDKT